MKPFARFAAVTVMLLTAWSSGSGWFNSVFNFAAHQFLPSPTALELSQIGMRANGVCDTPARSDWGAEYEKRRNEACRVRIKINGREM